MNNIYKKIPVSVQCNIVLAVPEVSAKQRRILQRMIP